MECTINKLAKLAGVSTRTLRYYDEFGLLSPTRISSNGYRIYGQKEIDLLQQILFYRELGVPLNEIKEILFSEEFDSSAALQSHLAALLEKRNQLDMLIANVKKTIKVSKGETIMSNKEKFDGFITKVIDENEKKYGAEIREKYGNDVINRSNTKLKGMTKEEYNKIEELRVECDTAIKTAFELGDPANEQAQKACELHKKWLCCYYNGYNKQYHKALGQMYVDDSRFTAYYDKIAVGCAEFLRDAIMIYCK